MRCGVSEGGSTMTETGSRIAGVTEEWLAAAVVRESAEAIVVTDPAGIIVLWNDGAARIFGFAAAEVMGQSLDVIIPEKLRERHWKGYFQTMATGYTRYGDKLLSVPATHRDGQRLSIEFSVALLRDDAGQARSSGYRRSCGRSANAATPRRSCAHSSPSSRRTGRDRPDRFFSPLTDLIIRRATPAPSRCSPPRPCDFRTPRRPGCREGRYPWRSGR